MSLSRRAAEEEKACLPVFPASPRLREVSICLWEFWKGRHTGNLEGVEKMMTMAKVKVAAREERRAPI